MSLFVPLEKPSAFRKMAAVMWPRPKEPLIFGYLDIDATQVLRFIRSYQEKYGIKITITHFLIKAFGITLSRHPEVNAKIHWGRVLLRKNVDIFVQVASDGGNDLSGAKIEKADQQSLERIAKLLQSDARNIREGKDQRYAKSRNMFKILPAFLLGPLLKVSSFLVNELHLDLKWAGMPLDPFGSMMITNVGSFGIDTGFAPFPSIARCPMIILVSEIKDRPWVDSGQVVVRPVLRLSGTFDHRVIDGFHAGKLVRQIQTFCMNPEQIMAEEDFEKLEEIGHTVRT